MDLDHSLLSVTLDGGQEFDSPIAVYLDELREELLSNTSGEVASYIPELSNADPNSFGICLATIDGSIYWSGDVDTEFSIQSMSKPFTYGQALKNLGAERVLQSVGVEPTGEAFNSIILDNVKNRPFNPMVNAGAISVANLLTGPNGDAEMLDLFSRLAGRDLSVDEAVFLSEQETGHRNRAISYMMLNTGMIDKDPEEILRLYFRQCAILVNCQDMARMAVCLANGGRNPTTEEQIYEPDQAKDILTLMSTCGMYDYAGQWAHEVGFPAKSGVAGGVIAVIPGQAGIAVWSPPLDAYGNSVRGVEVCKRLSKDFGLHVYGGKSNAVNVIRRYYTAAEVSSKRIRSRSEVQWLEENASQVSVTELQGMLYFGSTENVIRHLSSIAVGTSEVVVDFARVSNVDAAAARLLCEAIKAFQIGQRSVTFSGVSDSDLHAEVRKSVEAHGLDVQYVDQLDNALELAENRILSSHWDETDRTTYSLNQIDLFEGLEPSEFSALEGILSVRSYKNGDFLVHEGDEASTFMVMVSGAASISIQAVGGHRKRLASIGPGSTFGEMALVEGGRRSADVIADDPTMCYIFSIEKIEELATEYPNILVTLLSNMVRVVSGNLQKANEEIRKLD